MYYILKREQSGRFADAIFSEPGYHDAAWSEALRRLRILQELDSVNLPERTASHDKKRLLGDVVFSPPFLAVNKKVQSVMAGAGVDAQFLPFSMKSIKETTTPYFYVSIVNKAHVLDLNKSIYEVSDLSQKINSVTSVHVNEGADFGPLVRCYDSKLIFVKESLVQRFKEEGITGVEFCPINEFSGRP